jgi:hypothetical protein
MGRTVDVYVHGSKEEMWSAGERLGFTGEALQMFRHAAVEVKLTLEVKDDGSARIIAVDGRKVAD